MNNSFGNHIVAILLFRECKNKRIIIPWKFNYQISNKIVFLKVIFCFESSGDRSSLYRNNINVFKHSL